jgi:hypothetical protein
LLPDDEMPRSMQHQAALLICCFGWHEAHARPLYCLADRLGVGGVVLLSLDVCLDVGRQPNACVKRPF